MATKKVQYGVFGTGRPSLMAFLSATYIQGTGFKGVTLGDLKAYLSRQLNETLTKEKMFGITRKLFQNGYGIVDSKDWAETKIFESKKYISK